MKLPIALATVLAGRPACLIFTKSPDLYIVRERKNIPKSNQKVIGR
jgi:hypothetical protein